MNISERIESARGTVMNKDEFIEFISDIYHLSRHNYAEAARHLNHNSPSIRRVVNGGDSNSLRRTLNIKKSDRERQCFECTPATKHNIRLLRDETKLSSKDLLEEMVDCYFEYLENSY